jgi:transcriptional regulator with PAS, ATPase and Fis domain
VLTPEHFYAKCGAEYTISMDEPPDEEAQDEPAPDGHIPMRSLVKEYERSLIESALERVDNTRAAAKLLGISQATLLRKRSRTT